ncbi:hypothetical protein WJ972_09900 [Achromobacter insuavis]
MSNARPAKAIAANAQNIPPARSRPKENSNAAAWMNPPSSKRSGSACGGNASAKVIDNKRITSTRALAGMGNCVKTGVNASMVAIRIDTRAAAARTG